VEGGKTTFEFWGNDCSAEVTLGADDADGDFSSPVSFGDDSGICLQITGNVQVLDSFDSRRRYSGVNLPSKAKRVDATR
jgi:hypothetical protein